MSVQKKYEHYNSERNVELREWCSKKLWRSASIDTHVFGCNMISHYKNGKLNIPDSKWTKIKSTMVEIEREEKFSQEPLKPLIKPLSTNNHQQSSNNQIEIVLSFKKYIDDWLMHDRKSKLRLANAIYSVNYTKSFSNPFSEMIRRLDNDYLDIKDSTMNRIYKVIDKVNSMIAENHPLAIAAFKK
jgi:hypothetical protein